MGILGKIAQATIDIVTIPVAIVKDVVTLGGSLSEHGETYTGEKLRDIAEKAGEIYDDLDD